MSHFEIRTMRRDEVDFAVELAAREGWNPGLHDADCFYRTDPEGFLVGLLDGEPIGCISAVAYGKSFGFIGFYIVLPEHRGKGYGLRLWHGAMERLEGRNIGLDGVIAQQDNYRRSGFRPAYRNIRYEGRGGLTAPQADRLVPLTEIAFDNLLSYDRSFFPVDREPFLSCWISMPESAGVACVEKGRILGYGLVRKCRRGSKIGPLFADSPEIATEIFAWLSSRAEPGAPLYLDLPEVNASALALAEGLHMQRVFETARMYTKEAPPIATDRLFGVTSFELG